MDLEKYIQYPLICMCLLRATLMDLVYAKIKGKEDEKCCFNDC